MSRPRRAEPRIADPSMHPRRYVSLQVAAEYLEVHPMTLRKYLKVGLLTFSVFGRRRKVAVADLVEFENRHKVKRVAVNHPKPVRQYFRGVYFVRVNEFIKIGVSDDVVTRTSVTFLPYEVKPIGYIPTATAEEAASLEEDLHRRFSAARHKGEWFYESVELSQFIQTNLTAWPQKR